MVLLVLFAFVAGAGTALSPCVLPVLPALLSAGATSGPRRPVGIALGLAGTFTITIVGLAKVIDGVGLGPSVTRTVAIVVLIAFGFAMALPTLAGHVEAPLSRLSRYAPRSRGDGFASGLLAGAALGFLYAPCAGPILAAVIVVGAASARTVAVGLAFALGSGVVLLLLAHGGRALSGHVRSLGRGPWLQRALAATLVLTGVAMATDLDLRFQSMIADHLPADLVRPTRVLEDSDVVADRLSRLRPKSRFQIAARQRSHGRPSRLPKLGVAPDFVDTQRWFNTPGGQALSLASLRGRVVLVDFWTYTCINCLRTLPYLKAWDARYRKAGLTIVGVHSPEFPFERSQANVAAAIEREGIHYPVVQDNDLATWNAWSNVSWPADYLIDAAGQVRHVSVGEGDYDSTERAIRALLREAGGANVGLAMAKPHAVVTPGPLATPETYLGLAHTPGFVPLPERGVHTYPSAPPTLRGNQFAFAGTWDVEDESATAVRAAEIDAEVIGKDVYLVLSPPPHHDGSVQVRLDGRSIASDAAGADVRDGRVHVDRQRLYHIVSIPQTEQHRLTLRVSRGVSGFAFTFG